MNALALVARHPEDVRTLVAHEPPLSQVLPDREAALAADVDIHETYLREGRGPAMAKFIALVSHEGPIPADFVSRPAPDPARFGLPTEDDGSRDDPLLGQNMISCSHYVPDVVALRAASTHLVLGIGAESTKVITGRATAALAERLGTTPVIFPGGHAGFVPAEWGQGGVPDAFAARLREVLTAAGPRHAVNCTGRVGAAETRAQLGSTSCEHSDARMVTVAGRSAGSRAGTPRLKQHRFGRPMGQQIGLQCATHGYGVMPLHLGDVHATPPSSTSARLAPARAPGAGQNNRRLQLDCARAEGRSLRVEPQTPDTRYPWCLPAV